MHPLALLLLIAAGSPGEPSPIVNIVSDGAGAYSACGELVLANPVSVSSAWEVLTDFERIPTFIPAIVESRVTSSVGNHSTVEQIAQVRMLLFTRELRLRLAVDESPREKMSFQDTAHEDFLVYEGSWELAPTPDGVVARYQLSVKPKLTIPDSVARELVAHGAQAVLQDIQAEMMRNALPHHERPTRSGLWHWLP